MVKKIYISRKLINDNNGNINIQNITFDKIKQAYADDALSLFAEMLQVKLENTLSDDELSNESEVNSDK